MRRTLIGLAAAIAVASAVFVVANRPPPAPAPVAALGDFALVERDGSTVRRADLAGSPWVADFVFTRCAVYCPRLTARMKELRGHLPPDVRSVSITVDPEHDTPEVLAEYARSWGVTGREWLFLTGSREATWTLIRDGFLQAVEETPEVEASPILHSNRFVLVDSAGRLRGFYDAFDERELERLRADLRGVLAEEAR